MMGTLGWIGSILLAICGAPEAWKAHKTGKTELTWSFLLMWYLGEIFTFIPIIMDLGVSYLIFNYGLNIFFISVILKYKLSPRV